MTLSRASAADITITLNDKEQAALKQIFDLAVKQGGLAVVPNVNYLMAKITLRPPTKVDTQPVKPDGTVVNDELIKDGKDNK